MSSPPTPLPASGPSLGLVLAPGVGDELASGDELPLGEEDGLGLGDALGPGLGLGLGVPLGLGLGVPLGTGEVDGEGEEDGGVLGSDDPQAPSSVDATLRRDTFPIRPNASISSRSATYAPTLTAELTLVPGAIFFVMPATLSEPLVVAVAAT
ncbi:MAG: hypothetical protein FIA92_06390 [Chloroflexi bacterium]|nr:hypothetical protein [Chloroflexota bacterium]